MPLYLKAAKRILQIDFSELKYIAWTILHSLLWYSGYER